MKYSKSSNIDVKKINKNNVFRYILKNATLSNQDIAKVLKMSGPTVQLYTNEWENVNFSSCCPVTFTVKSRQ